MMLNCMRVDICVTLFLILVLVVGCGKEGPTEQQAVRFPVRQVHRFAEEQIITNTVQVTAEWQTITFAKPLRINREGLQGLHLAVDQRLYIANNDVEPDNINNAYCLWRIRDGALIKPEAFLIGNEGTEVCVRPEGHIYPYFNEGIVTVCLGADSDEGSTPRPFPESIKAFTALRIRADEPFLIRYLWWRVDFHPAIFVE